MIQEVSYSLKTELCTLKIPAESQGTEYLLLFVIRTAYIELMQN